MAAIKFLLLHWRLNNFQPAIAIWLQFNMNYCDKVYTSAPNLKFVSLTGTPFRTSDS